MHEAELPSLHDHLLISYEVNCEERQIKLRARMPACVPEPGVRTILFDGVEGYSFVDDAFGNIVQLLRRLPLEQIVRQHGPEIAAAYERAGAPGAWAANLNSAPEVLAAKGVKGFELSSSYGLSGWVLAKTAAVVDS